MADRAGVFLDAGYLKKTLEREHDRIPVSYAALLHAVLPQGSGLLRGYYYDCPPALPGGRTTEERRLQSDVDRFYRALNRIPGLQVRPGRLARRRCDRCGDERWEQKRVDVLLSLDLLRLSLKGRMTHAVLIAGDSDFVPAVLAAKEEGVLVRLVHGGPANPAHRDLLEACDDRLPLTRELIESVRRS